MFSVIERWAFFIASSSSCGIINMFHPDQISRALLSTQSSILESSFLFGWGSVSSAARRCSRFRLLLLCQHQDSEIADWDPNTSNPSTEWGMGRKCSSWPEVEGWYVTSHMRAALMWAGCSLWNHILADIWWIYLSCVCLLRFKRLFTRISEVMNLAVDS